MWVVFLIRRDVELNYIVMRGVYGKLQLNAAPRHSNTKLNKVSDAKYPDSGGQLDQQVSFVPGPNK